MLWLVIIAGFILALGDMLVIAAAGTFRKELDLPDFAALLCPWAAMGVIVGFIVFLPWQLALVLSLAVAVLTIWGVMLLLKVPAKRRPL